MPIYRCHKCNTPWESQARQPGVKATCDRCGAYLHCCKNCRHHRPSMHNECYIPNTEWVGDRRGPNFCDEFAFRDADAVSAPDSTSAEARAQAQALLGEADSKVPSLHDLFGAEEEKDAPGDRLDERFEA